MADYSFTRVTRAASVKRLAINYDAARRYVRRCPRRCIKPAEAFLNHFAQARRAVPASTTTRALAGAFKSLYLGPPVASAPDSKVGFAPSERLRKKRSFAVLVRDIRTSAAATSAAMVAVVVVLAVVVAALAVVATQRGYPGVRGAAGGGGEG